MKKRFSEEQIIGFLQQAEAGMPVKELCRQHGFSDGSFYNWRAKFGGMSVPDAKRLKALEAENARLKRVAGRIDPRCRGTQGGSRPKTPSPQQKREAVMVMRESTTISERRACLLVGLSRTVLHYESKVQPENKQFARFLRIDRQTPAIIETDALKELRERPGFFGRQAHMDGEMLHGVFQYHIYVKRKTVVRPLLFDFDNEVESNLQISEVRKK